MYLLYFADVLKLSINLKMVRPQPYISLAHSILGSETEQTAQTHYNESTGSKKRLIWMFFDRCGLTGGISHYLTTKNLLTISSLIAAEGDMQLTPYKAILSFSVSGLC